ncbi:MAG TPA: tetraacyldisaccharide 4'-kinase [Armatimonadota bacterium]|jgi:tetraacyldisaccharide 4'-kinase
MPAPEQHPSLQNWWLALIAGAPRTPADRLAYAGLRALTYPYRAVIAANLALYESGLKPRTRPALPVISVGNLSLGGTGKSTTVAFLARRLEALGVLPGVVTRGYGRQDPDSLQLVTAGHGLLVGHELSGDEPAMLAALLPGVPVVAGKRREPAVNLLRRQTAAQVCLLDDGFQYFRMRKLLDLVLVDASRSRPGDRVFPAGPLREPWSHLRRAQQVWLTHADRARPEDLDTLRRFLRRLRGVTDPVLTRHLFTRLRGPHSEQEAPHVLNGTRVLALSGLGNPDSFEDSLRAQGAEVIPCRFPDHHHYTVQDLEKVGAELVEHSADLVVTTEKDAVKLPARFSFEVWIAESELDIMEGEEQVTAALAAVRSAVKL